MKNFNALNSSPYNPYPADLKGCFCEINQNDATYFFEINYIEYSEEQVERLESMGVLEESILGQYIKIVNKDNINLSTYYLYKLQVYKANPLIKDLWLFNDSISEYQEYGFVKFADLIKFCFTKWGLSKKDFVPIHETHIPN